MLQLVNQKMVWFYSIKTELVNERWCRRIRNSRSLQVAPVLQSQPGFIWPSLKNKTSKTQRKTTVAPQLNMNWKPAPWMAFPNLHKSASRVPSFLWLNIYPLPKDIALQLQEPFGGLRIYQERQKETEIRHSAPWLRAPF